MRAAVKIKQWGNGLGVRLNSTVARAAGMQADTLVSVSVVALASSSSRWHLVS